MTSREGLRGRVVAGPVLVASAALLPTATTLLVVFLVLPQNVATGPGLPSVWQFAGNVWAMSVVLVALTCIVIVALIDRLIRLTASGALSLWPIISSSLYAFGLPSSLSVFVVGSMDLALEHVAPVEARGDMGYEIVWLMRAGCLTILCAIIFSVVNSYRRRVAPGEETSNA